MFLVCCRIGEYISLERFCFVNLTSSCSLVPYIERGRERERITAAVAFLFLVFVLHNRMLLRASKNDSNSCTTTEIIIQASLLQSVAFCVSGLCAVLPLMSLYHCWQALRVCKLISGAPCACMLADDWHEFFTCALFNNYIGWWSAGIPHVCTV